MKTLCKVIEKFSVKISESLTMKQGYIEPCFFLSSFLISFFQKKRTVHVCVSLPEVEPSELLGGWKR